MQDAIPAILTTEQLSNFLLVPINTLKRWRCEGTGPSFFHAGRSVRYRRLDVEAYIERSICRSVLDGMEEMDAAA